MGHDWHYKAITSAMTGTAGPRDVSLSEGNDLIVAG